MSVASATARTTLLPDSGGTVRRIAVAVPPEFFSQAHQARLSAWSNLAKALPARVTLVVLTEARAEPQARTWIAGLAPTCAVTVAALAPPDALTSRHGAGWVQDRCLIATEAGKPKYLTPIFGPKGDHAVWLGALDEVGAEPIRLDLAGGNCLVGEDFWLVGADSVRSTSQALGTDFTAAQTAIAALDPRPLHVVGYYPSQLGSSPESLPWRAAEARDQAQLERTSIKSVRPPRSSEELAQPLFHLDLMISVTGRRDEHGRPILLVADPLMPPATSGAEAHSHAVRLNAMAERLEQDGPFRVFRNPVPYIPAPRRKYRVPRTYNNVIVENEPGNTVWLSQFGDLEPALTPVDLANRSIWEELGFTVVPVLGWSAFAASVGGLRCATKVLARDGCLFKDQAHGAREGR